jgi:hypothetical protein
MNLTKDLKDDAQAQELPDFYRGKARVFLISKVYRRKQSGITRLRVP